MDACDPGVSVWVWFDVGFDGPPVGFRERRDVERGWEDPERDVRIG